MANRQNAKRFTGPHTAAGKSISSRNAFRHGLSRSLESDEAAETKIDALARAIAGENPQSWAMPGRLTFAEMRESGISGLFGLLRRLPATASRSALTQGPH